MGNQEANRGAIAATGPRGVNQISMFWDAKFQTVELDLRKQNSK